MLSSFLQDFEFQECKEGGIYSSHNFGSRFWTNQKVLQYGGGSWRHMDPILQQRWLCQHIRLCCCSSSLHTLDSRAIQRSLDGYWLTRCSAEEWARRKCIPTLWPCNTLHRCDALYAYQLGYWGLQAVLWYPQMQRCLQTSRIRGRYSWTYDIGHSRW
jgi:hypothetical protein